MINVSRKILGFRYQIIYNAPVVPPFSGFGLLRYRNPAQNKCPLLFVRSTTKTKIIDLTQSAEDIFNGFKKNTRAQIRSAISLGVAFSLSSDFDSFLEQYIAFEQSKNGTFGNVKTIIAHKEHLVIAKATLDSKDLVLHSYIVDHEAKSVLLYTSSSLFRLSDDDVCKKHTGQANRLLHYRSMLYFKEIGIHTYDLGGYATDISNKEKVNINAFKDRFGGDVQSIIYFTSSTIYLYMIVNRAYSVFKTWYRSIFFNGHGST